MRRRPGITAFLTLIAMVFSFTGTAFASSCGTAAQASADSHVEHESGSEQPASHHDSGQPLPDCPFGFRAGCATAPSLAAHAVSTLITAPEQRIATLFVADVVDRVRSHIIFHPPRF